MALISCPECGNSVSSFAPLCPHCGFPLIPEQKPKRPGRPSKELPSNNMRLPNGYGTVTFLKGNRRKPYAAKVNPRSIICDKKKTKYYKYDLLGCFDTREKAVQAIISYNQNPYNVTATKMTFTEVYEKWSEKHFEKIGDARSKRIKQCYNMSEPLHNQIFRNLRLIDFQNIVDSSERGYNAMNDLKIFWGQLYKYAMKYEICDRDYSAGVDLENLPIILNPHSVFTPKERTAIFSNSGFNIYCTIPIILILSGVRINELLSLSKSQVHMEDEFFEIKDSKTFAGIRKVPIHSYSKKFWGMWMDSQYDYVFYAKDGRQLTYNNYRMRYWIPEMDMLNLPGHKVHDTRHTFSTLAKEAGMDEYARKVIMGHALDNITDRVYTHADMNWLKKEIEKISIDI